jgi:hypothetical protein
MRTLAVLGLVLAALVLVLPARSGPPRHAFPIKHHPTRADALHRAFHCVYDRDAGWICPLPSP